MKYLEEFADTIEETVRLVESGEETLDDLSSIDELMPMVTDLLRAGRGDLALPFYEKALPYLEQMAGFAYGNLLQFDAFCMTRAAQS